MDRGVRSQGRPVKGPRRLRSLIRSGGRAELKRGQRACAGNLLRAIRFGATVGGRLANTLSRKLGC